MSSNEEIFNTVVETKPNEQIDSVGIETEQQVQTRLYPSPWNYLKCIFWTVVTGIFSCGQNVFEFPVVDQWPDRNYSVENTRNSELDPSHCEESSSGLDCLIYQNPITEAAPSHIEATYADEATSTTELFNDDGSSLVSAISIINYAEESLLKNVTFELESSLQNGILVEPNRSFSPTCTLLSAYYTEANIGLIDDLTRDTLVRELINSVIPRNLSDCSDTVVSPRIRRMYAWEDPPTENGNYPNIPKKSIPLNLDTNSTNSDEHLPYPGKLIMSDHSYSPLSPATEGSNNTLDTFVNNQTTDGYNDINVPNVDRQDHTLAWAMANLQMGTKEADKVPLTERPPIPTSFTRQGRDKSPVSTINSARIVDTRSVPDRMGFDGYFFEESNATPKPKRSSSLKSTRTPPGTPGQKAVRFADALGLDLESVRHVFDQETPPKIPASATFDLELDSDEAIAKLGAKQFRVCFPQPGAAANFIRRVLEETVCLEDAHVQVPRGLLIGTIRVKSLGFEKRVYVRVTYNDWTTYCDTATSYVQGSHDGVTDRFSFSLVFPDTMVPGKRAQFAIRYDTHTGQQFWDNNHGQNYSVMCYAKATDLAGDGSWVHYL